jgi:hypothetical protein
LQFPAAGLTCWRQLLLLIAEDEENTKRHMLMTYYRKVFVRCLIIALGCFLCRPTWAQVRTSSPNDRARYLATMPVSDGSPLKALESLPAYQEQSKLLSDQWQHLEKKRWNSLSAWAATEVTPHINAGLPVFYMFGGPDFVNVYLIYPDAPQFVLCGLEPVGSVPPLESMSTEDLEAGLRGIHASLEPMFRMGFFVTKDMIEALRHGDVYGVLPVLYVSLARTGNSITSVEYLKLSEAGKLTGVPEDSKNRDGVKGVKITFTHAGASASQELYYFREDVSDKALGHDNRFLNYLNALGPGNTYLKAASYLMHLKDFTLIRDFLLSRSASILQDDSGIPYRYFLTESWHVTLYGNYTKTIKDFKWAFQDDLQKAYQSSSEVKPMPFKTGYGTREYQNLLFATRAEKKSPRP